MLLTQTYPQAITVARDLLADDSNHPAQVAVAEAIATTSQTQLEFIKPLLVMLTTGDSVGRAASAHALACFKDDSVVDAFVAVVKDVRAERETRLVVVQSMRRMLDKRVIDALIVILDETDESLRVAAADSLASLTGNRDLGHSSIRWKEWWTPRRDKPRANWVCDVADNLVRVNADLARDNDELRRRLATSLNDLYAACSTTAKDVQLVEMLKDSLPEIRLAGAKLAQQRLANTQQPVPEALRAQIRSCVGDPDPAVRGAAAVMLAGIADAKTIQLLLDRLREEQLSECREGIYQALGLLRDPDVADQLVKGVAEQDRRVASAAANSLARLAEKGALSDARKESASDALRKRYAVLTEGPETASLREALLTAMVNLKDRRLSELMTLAMKDSAPAIRLNAIRGLQNLNLPESLPAIAGMTSDTDRGVRLSAVAAVGAMGGVDYIETLLSRTDVRVETDPAVREQSWNVVTNLLTKLDTPRLSALADRLAQRPDAGPYLVSVLKLWAERIPEDKPDQWLPVRQRLGEGLMAASRPAEAAGELAKVHAGLTRSGDAKAQDIYLKLIEALLAADDASAAVKIAESRDPAQFVVACESLQKRLTTLKEKKDWDNLVNLCMATKTKLGPRLTPTQRFFVEDTFVEARKQQRMADEARVSALVPKLLTGDEVARLAATKDLTAMNQRAVAPLIGSLKVIVQSDTPDPTAEKTLLDLLSSLSPQLKGYDLASSVTDRLKTIESWLKTSE